jgi:tetratricopeptide (TPR) repeat protein
MWSRVIYALLAIAAVAVSARASAEPQPQAPSTADQGSQHVRRLIRQLGDRDYFVRQRAEAELAKIGFEAFDAVSEATASEDAEVAARARYLLRLMRVEWADREDPPEVKKLLQDYESQDADAREGRMHRLANLPGRSGIPALCRLVRYEQSAVLSKQAAVELLDAVKAGEEPDRRMVEVLRKALGKSQCAGAEWLLAYARFGEDPGVAAGPWSKLVEAEESLLQTSSDQTSPEIVAKLLQFQVVRLKKIGRDHEADVALRRLLRLEKGEEQTLLDLVQWLIGQKAWQAVDEVADRFAPQIADNPGLRYFMAEAQLARGNKARAERMAAETFALNPGKEAESLGSHFSAATFLQQRGLCAWATREYRHVIALGPPAGPITLTAELQLAEMDHDQADDLAAGELLEGAVKALAANARGNGNQPDNKSKLRAQMNYYFACHWERKGDHAKARRHLEQALADDSANIEVLIACFQLPDQSPQFHRRIREWIRAAAAQTRTLIAANPELAINYNQLAWLIANTEGDLDEALQLSWKSLELSPDTGGYYDTLGRVYFAKGDCENAVAYQSKAVELDPHSGLVRRQLELFRKKLEEKKQKKQASWTRSR